MADNIELTAEMIAAGAKALEETEHHMTQAGSAEAVYRAMIAAAPKVEEPGNG